MLSMLPVLPVRVPHSTQRKVPSPALFLSQAWPSEKSHSMLVQIAGGVTMNNTMCLGLFLLVVWYKGLEWTYTSEVLATVGTCSLCAAFASHAAAMPARHAP